MVRPTRAVALRLERMVERRWCRRPWVWFLSMELSWKRAWVTAVSEYSTAYVVKKYCLAPLEGHVFYISKTAPLNYADWH